MGCLAEHDLLEATRAGALDRSPALEAHLAACPACSAVVAALVAGDRDPAAADRWGALVGTTLGPYRLDAQIGAGAMGAVYRGWDGRLHRPVAVKVLVATGVGGIGIEARAAAAIVHRNVVTVYDVGDAHGHAYVVSELVDGESLRSVLAAGAVSRDRAVRLGLELVRGLAAAHAAGIVHRDLKPENILIARDGTLKILDFGLAKLAGELDPGDATEPGTVRGTIGYMAPEQARGEVVDARADLFAAGAILYELITGRRAFAGGSHAEKLTAVLRDTPPGLDDPALGPIGPVIARCLAKDRDARFHSAHDLGWVLEDVDGRSPSTPTPASAPLRRSRRAFVIGGAAAAATTAIGFALGRRGREIVAAPAPATHQLTFRRGRVVTARFARDGTTVYFGAAWDGDPLAAFALRLAGGLARRLDAPGADVLAASRTHLAIGIGRRNVAGQCATGRLALVPIDGGAPRTLADDVQDADLSADGSELALVRRDRRRFQLEWPLGQTRLATGEWISHPRIAPDGRSIACLVHPHPNDDAGRAVVIDRGGATRTITDGWDSIAGLAWHPRGGLVVSGARDGAGAAVHAVTLAGAHRRVFETVGRLRLHDITARGDLLISRDAWRLRTVAGGDGIADVDRSLTPASIVVDASPDGTALLIGELGDVDEVNGVYVVPAADGPRLRLGPGMPRAQTSDRSKVLALAFDSQGGPPRPVIYTAAGAATPIALVPRIRIRWARWLDDDDRLVIGGEVRGQPSRLWRLSIRSGAPEPITAEGSHGVGAIDPTRREVAFVDDDARLQVVAIATGAARVVPGSFADQVACGWLDEGILVRTTYAPIEIRRIDPATGTATGFRTLSPPALGLKGVDAVVLAAAGTRHAYSYGEELSELFVVDAG